jgi:hypothetical protein
MPKTADTKKAPAAKKVAAKKAPKKKVAAKAKKAAPADGSRRAMNAYMHFAIATRPAIKKSHPDLKQTEIAQELGKRWAKISEADKAIYVKMHESDKKFGACKCDL